VTEKLHILQVNTNEVGGGAERVAHNLFQRYRAAGHDSWLAVAHKVSPHPDILLLRHAHGGWGWSRACWWLHARAQTVDCNGRVSHWIQRLAEPRAIVDHFRGIENFHHPGTWKLLTLPDRPPDVLHCHNLHGDYFDLRALPWLSSQVTTVLTLHDAWLLSGHCAHFVNCERWRIGCGECPDLGRYPAVRRDATAYNWGRKREIYQQSRLYIATPSQWLMDKAKESILISAAVETKVIPNGVDTGIFQPKDREAARASLGLPHKRKILLFTASRIRANIWKDFQMLREVIGRVTAAMDGERLLFIALGEDAPAEKLDGAEIRFIPYERDLECVASYYQAADLYIHAANADTFPNSVLEALACGTPVVATAVGGIPEQIKGLALNGAKLNQHSSADATGFLVTPGNAEEMAAAIRDLLKNESAREQMSRNAAADATTRFSLNRQAESYLKWYQQICHSEQ
jgi:glycosyltransferase involved in cell wall biosynthesis